MSTAINAERRQYGNFRTTRRAGLFGIPLLVLGLLLVAGFFGLMMAITGRLWAALAWAVVMVAATMPVLHRDSHDRHQYEKFATRMSFALRRRAGTTVYQSGATGRTPDGRCRMPGLLAASELSEHLDAYGTKFGLLWVPATSHYSVVLECAPVDHRLLDDNDVDDQVARWGGWLADLGSMPGVQAASVTVETSPDSGVELRRNLSSQLAPDAPPFAAATLDEIAQTFPAAAARISTRITVTWTAIPPVIDEPRPGTRRRKSRPKPRSREAMAAEIGNVLPAILAGLRQAGAGNAVRAMTAQDIVDETRVAFDPRIALTVEQARTQGGTGLQWEDAGPTVAVEGWDAYRHDGAWSRTWFMTRPHRGTFPSDSLSWLLSPHRDITTKRFTLLFRPEPVIRSAQIVDRAIKDANSEANQKKQTSERDLHAIRLARRTAEEEAQGAALVRFAVVITATVLDPAHLPLASTTVQSLAARPRLHVRVSEGNQAVAFLAGLPLGLVLPKHMALSPDLRDFLL
jgi:hypothetical protein